MRNRNFSALSFWSFFLLPVLAFCFPEKKINPDSLPPTLFQHTLRETIAFLDSLDKTSGDPALLPLSGFYIGTEQDFFSTILPNEDRNYSMGFSLGFVGPKTNRELLILPLFRKWVTAIPLCFVKKNRRPVSIFNEKARAAWLSSFDFKAAGFTPFDLEATTPVRDDRPYANPVAIGASLNRLLLEDSVRRRPWHVRTAFYFGLFGSGVGREFQSKGHREHWFGSTRPVPVGWHNQIANGGGVAALYTIGASTPIAKLSRQRDDQKFWVQTVGTGELMAGWLTNAAVGFGVKAGWFKTPFWIGNDISSREISQAPGVQQRPYGFCVYARPRLRLVAHNALLSGQMFDFLGKPSVHTLSGSQINRVIFEFETGLAVKLKAWTITVEPMAGRSPEFNTAQKRWHFWGTLHLSVMLDQSDPKRLAIQNYRNQLDLILRTTEEQEEEEE